MKDQDQFKAIAELDGWTFTPSRDVNNAAQPEYWYSDNDEIEFCYKDYPVDYSTRDAIISVIEKQNYTVKARIIRTLLASTEIEWDNFGVSGRVLLQELIPALTATPSQLREALLRATGRWKE